MKFTIERDELHEALQKVVNVVPQRSTISMTQNVLINAENGRVELSATDLEISIVSRVEANVEESGSLAVPGRLINDFVRELPNVQISFQTDENFRLDLASSNGKYKIAGENPAEFPQKPDLPDFKEIALSNKALGDLIGKTIFTCSTDELRPALTGVYFEIGGGRIQTVATDGHRLAMMKVSDEGLPAEDISAIISTRALNFVLRSLETEGQTSMLIGTSHALFRTENTELYARLIDEVYVEYTNVIPSEISHEMIVDTAQFYSSIKRVSLFSNPITFQVIMKIYKDHVDIHAEDVDFGGQAQESIPCEFSGDDFVIGFNARYLQDVLRHVDTAQVVMQFVRPDYAVLVRPVNMPEGEEQLMLLMPIRLGQD